ncbi:MAG: acylphosphatase [Planctomycetes bacterium]|nr:acylphosphatase [Planctomycetota bacterium]
MEPAQGAAHVLVRGRVQGVGFRWFVRKTANRLGIDGWVRNLPDGAVEAFVQGDDPALETMKEELSRGPRLARVDDLVWNARSQDSSCVSFVIRS